MHSSSKVASVTDESNFPTCHECWLWWSHKNWMRRQRESDWDFGQEVLCASHLDALSNLRAPLAGIKFMDTMAVVDINISVQWITRDFATDHFTSKCDMLFMSLRFMQSAEGKRNSWHSRRERTSHTRRRQRQRLWKSNFAWTNVQRGKW